MFFLVTYFTAIIINVLHRLSDLKLIYQGFYKIVLKCFVRDYVMNNADKHRILYFNLHCYFVISYHTIFSRNIIMYQKLNVIVCKKNIFLK